jgi:hypothetical protein
VQKVRRLECRLTGGHCWVDERGGSGAALRQTSIILITRNTAEEEARCFGASLEEHRVLKRVALAEVHVYKPVVKEARGHKHVFVCIELPDGWLRQYEGAARVGLMS